MADPQPARGRALSDSMPTDEWMRLRQFGQIANELSPKEVYGNEIASLVQQINEPIGVARGLLHSGEGLFGALNFASRLLDETDVYKHPKGQAAWDDVVGAGQKAINYGKAVWRDPAKLGDDLDQALIDYQAR